MDNWELALEFWSLELFVVLDIGGPDMGHRFQFWARKNMKHKFGSGRRCFRIQLGSGIYYLFTDLVLGNNISRPGLGLGFLGNVWVLRVPEFWSQIDALGSGL